MAHAMVHLAMDREWPDAPAPQRRHPQALRLGLCRQYRPIFDWLGPGEHLLGRQNRRLVSHLMWITRWLQPGVGTLLPTAYEMVATAPALQRRGHATSLLEYFPSQVEDLDWQRSPRGGDPVCPARLGPEVGG